MPSNKLANEARIPLLTRSARSTAATPAAMIPCLCVLHAVENGVLLVNSLLCLEDRHARLCCVVAAL